VGNGPQSIQCSVLLLFLKALITFRKDASASVLRHLRVSGECTQCSCFFRIALNCFSVLDAPMMLLLAATGNRSVFKISRCAPTVYIHSPVSQSGPRFPSFRPPLFIYSPVYDRKDACFTALGCSMALICLVYDLRCVTYLLALPALTDTKDLVVGCGEL
jgi:hypothetical protein